MKALVTGFTGTLGSNLLPLLYEFFDEVIGYSRDELKQQQYPKHEKLTMYLGDVRDRDRLQEASRGVECIFHLAALKHVDKLEENPEEAIATNVMGTMNVLHCQRMNEIPKVVMASTDKACRPINTYGKSKAIAEDLVLRNPNNVVCRYGNVAASRGSVIPKFMDSIKKENKIYLTHSDMTRFWIIPKAAANFVHLSSALSGLQIPRMRACSVKRLALMVAKMMHVDGVEIENIGLRPGEKIHEDIQPLPDGSYLSSNNPNIQMDDRELEDFIALVGKK